MINYRIGLGFRHWDFIRHSPSFSICLLLVALVGCASHPQKGVRVPDWDSQSVVGPASRLSSPQQDVISTNIIETQATASERPAPSIQFTETWVALERWCKACGLASPCKVLIAPAAAYSLETENGVFLLHVGSQVAQWNGTDLRMGFAPQLINGVLFVHRLDMQKTIEPLIVGCGPLLKSEPLSSGSEWRPTIVIDPGHGGEDSGAKSILANHYEKEFTLDWARRLGWLLERNGWRVFLTRTNDQEISLSNRVLFAQEHKADLFVSLHFNSAGTNENQSGLETYCLTPTGMASSVTRGFPDQSHLIFPNNEFDGENLRLASLVHKELLQVNGHRDRSVRRARFPGVLRGQQRPAILIEGGYLTNRREAAQIATADYREKLAEAVAGALQAVLKAKG